jgi:hypothetical protein
MSLCRQRVAAPFGAEPTAKRLGELVATSQSIESPDICGDTHGLFVFPGALFSPQGLLGY